MKKNYLVGNFFKQCIMCNIEGIEVTGYEEIHDKNRVIVQYSFDENNAEVNKFLDDYREGLYKDIKIENFAELKIKRKEMIKAYLDSCYNK